MDANMRLIWTTELVNTFWDGISRSSLDDLSFAKINGEKLINLVMPWLQSKGTVLDFGAGSGYLVQNLLNRGYRVAAFDPSDARQSAMATLAGDHSNFLGFDNGKGMKTYDVVFFSEVIEHLLEESYEETLSRLTRFVSPGGALIITTPNQENISQKLCLCPTCNHFFHPWQHVRSIKPEFLINEFRRFGFKKEFIGLVDFSDDAEIIEYGRISKNLLNDLEDCQDNYVSYVIVKALENLKLARMRIAAMTGNGGPYPQMMDASNQIDFLIGNQSTIVYVGMKTSSDGD